MKVHLVELQVKYNYRDLDLIFKVIAAILFFMEMVSAQFLEKYWPSLTEFSIEVHLESLQVKFNYHDLNLIFKVMIAILFIIELVSAQYVEK